MKNKRIDIAKKVGTLEKRVDLLEKQLQKMGLSIDSSTENNSQIASQVYEPLFGEAIKIIVQFEEISASLLQRRLSIGYARAARLLDLLEEKGYIESAHGSRPRKVLNKSKK